MDNELDDNLSDRSFAELLKITYDHTGITIGDGRKSLMVSRLRRRLRATNLKDFESYVRLLKKPGSEELEHFINSVTTNKTYFYRTPRIWDYLTKEFIPEWMNRSNNGRLNVWSGASSTGEEIYTAGILLEDIRRVHPTFDYQIIGTDVSARVVKEAQTGLYTGRAIQRFREEAPELFERYMVGDDTAGFGVLPRIRQRIKFKQHNIFEPYRHTTKFDVALLRNVLIYFTKPDQEKALRNIDRSLHDNGVLIIGESETLAPLNTNFASVAPLVYRAPEFAAGKAA